MSSRKFKFISPGVFINEIDESQLAAFPADVGPALIGRFEKERDAIPAIALTTDSSIITSLANDYSFDKIFERQCEALIQPNDIIFVLSTSGNSPNVINGVKVAKKKNIISIGLLGNNGGNLKDHLTIPIIVTSNSTPRIQEVHRIILHAICQIVEDNFSKTN